MRLRGSALNQTYSHTQIGYAGYAVMASSALAVLWTARSTAVIDAPPAVRIALGIITLVLVLTGGAFSALKIQVQDDVLRWSFGPGVFRNAIRISDIQQASAVRNPWYYGFGLRFIPEGRLYNVSGLGAVEIVLRSGAKVRLGSDEPDVLVEAIRAAQQSERETG